MRCLLLSVFAGIEEQSEQFRRLFEVISTVLSVLKLLQTILGAGQESANGFLSGD